MRWLAVVGALAACSKTRAPDALTTRELPGFSIDLPHGRTEPTSTSSYGDGMLDLRDVGDRDTVSVGWSYTISNVDDGELLESLARGEFSSLPQTTRHTTIPGPGQVPATTIVIDTGWGAVTASMVPCGRRSISLVTDLSRQTLGLHAQVLATIRCHPDPKLEGDISIGVQLELPNFVAVGRGGATFLVDDPTTPTVLIAIARHATAALAQERDELTRSLAAPPLGDKIGAPTFRPWEGDHAEFTTTKTAVSGFARLIRCGDTTTEVVAVAFLSDHLEPVRARVLGAKCTGPGERDSAWPDAKL